MSQAAHPPATQETTARPTGPAPVRPGPAPGARPAADGDRRGVLDTILADVPPTAGGVVMGTGIVSIALHLDGRELLSQIVLVLAAAAWIMLGVLAAARELSGRGRFRRDMADPAALTAVAGTAVLGTRLTLLGWTWAGVALMVVTLALWVGLLTSVVRHLARPTIGISFILTVATEAVALLATEIARSEHAGWLLVAALVMFVAGLALYLFVASRFAVRELAVGAGDHWLTGGALAITTVAASQIAQAAEQIGTLDPVAGLLTDAAVALWALTMLWLPVLLFAESRWRRPAYDMHRWSTVFPVGMYAACSFSVGGVAAAPAITSFGRVWVWVALAFWALVAAGLVRSARDELTAVPDHSLMS